MSETKSGFSRDFLVKIGRSNPTIPALIFIPMFLGLWAWSIAYGTQSWGGRVGLLFAGIFGWTLIEYVLHRFSFHTYGHEGKSFRNPIRLINALSSGVHGLHHDKPNYPDLVVAPPLLSLGTSWLYLGILYLIFGSFEVAGLVISGVLAGYLWYEFVHFSTHQKKPTTRVWKYLTKYHMVHHFTDHDNYFGVTSPLWDYVFGTMPKKISIK